MTGAVEAPGVEVHPLATCCWCGSAFMRGKDVLEVTHPERPHPWVCPVHWRDQMAAAMVVELKGKARQTRFVPLPRQVEAMRALEGRPTYILIGGAAGGSKSKGLREIAHTACMTRPAFRVLLLRRTYKELDQTHLRDAEVEAPEMGATAVPSAKLVRYLNGSTLQFGHCETSADAMNYLSAEYDLIIFDELVTFEELQFLLISSRARSTKAGVKPKILAGTNPGGPQAHWVRARFVDKTVDLDTYPDYDPEDYCYIPSKLDDNPYLDKAYERKLLALPPELRRAYRDGDWDIFPGQYFPEFRKARHVATLPIPPTARWYRAIDWGFVKPGVCLWIAMLPEGRAYVAREWVFTRVINSEQAKAIKAKSEDWNLKVMASIADTGMWTPDGDSGESPAETYGRYGVPLQQADKERVAGWSRIREWLRDAPDGKPWLMISPDCPYLIRTLPSLISADNKPEDVNSDSEDHAADALRYFVMSRAQVGTEKPATRVSPNSVKALKEQALSAANRIRRFGRVA